MHGSLPYRQDPRAGSAIYEGQVAHQRKAPVDHGFRYPVFMPLFDLAELPELLDPFPLWSARRPAPARFRRSDYLGDPDQPLIDAARETVAEQTGLRPGGPVKLLTNPRYWGFGLNPVSFYFLYGTAHDAPVEAMIAHVTNTPWGQDHAYVLTPDSGSLGGSFEKELHVSPFMPMDQDYVWRSTEPGERLRLSIANHEDGERVFVASLDLERHEITSELMARLLRSYPPMTIAAFGRIYWNALKLKFKGVRYFTNPSTADRKDPTR